MTHEIENNSEDKHRKLGYLQLVLVIVFIGGAFGISRYLASLQTTQDPQRRTSQRELIVEAARVAPQTYRLRFSTTGTVQVRAMTDIVPQVSGRIVDIDDSAFPGGLITPETVLFQIEKSDYRLAVEQMEAEVARAETQLDLQKAGSKTAIEEWRRLNPDTPPPPLVAEEPQLAEAQASLEAARARLKTAQLDLARTDFKLPFTGRITEFGLEVGQYVVVGQSYGKAYRLASLEIDVPLEEQQLDWLLETEAPIIRVTSGYLDGEAYSAYVKRISGKVDTQTRFSRAVLGIKDPEPDIVPDVFVGVDVTGPERRDVWVLPLSALQENGRIWTVTREKRLGSIQPEILQITEEHVVAKSDGTTIIVVLGNLPEATADTPVRLTNEAETKTDGG